MYLMNQKVDVLMIWHSSKRQWTKRCSICIDIKQPTVLKKMSSMTGLSASTRTNRKTSEDSQTSMHICLKIAKTFHKITKMDVPWALNASTPTLLMKDYITR